MDHKHIVAITGIIVKEGKYLITQRSFNKKAFPGKWTLPGGGLEVSDYLDIPKDTSEHWYRVLEKALRREIFEEVGLKVGEITYLTNLAFLKKEEPCLVISMFAPYQGGEVVLNDESIDYRWVSLEEAIFFDLIEGIYEELVILDDLLSKNSAKKMTFSFDKKQLGGEI